MITVIINLYEYDKYKTLDCINNVKNQNFEEFEIIINCKNNKQILENLLREENIENIKVFQGFNFKKLIKNSKGEYIINKIFEDKWMPNMLENQIKEFKKNDIDIVCCNFYYCDELSRIKETPDKIIDNIKLYYNNNLKDKTFYSTLIKKCSIKKEKEKDTFEEMFLELLNNKNISIKNCNNRLYLKQK